MELKLSTGNKATHRYFLRRFKMGTLVKTISIVLGCCFFMTTHILAEESSPVVKRLIMSDAWEALHSGNHEEVVRLTEACFKECTEQALEQQKSGAIITTLMQMNILNSTV